MTVKYRGVYWPGETMRYLRTETLAEQLDELKRANVNLVWITNGYEHPGEWQTLVRLASDRGIQVLAGRGSWYVSDKNASNPETVNLAFARLQLLQAPIPQEDLPLAWVIGDEPTTFQALTKLGQLAGLCKGAGIKTAAVTVPAFIEDMGKLAPKLDFFAMDHYPFFAKGLPSNPPQGLQAILTYSNQVAKMIKACPKEATSITICQAFQSWEGPAEEEADGSITLLPGAKPIWRPPTYWEVYFQAVIAGWHGSQGVVFFAYGLNGYFVPDPNAIAPFPPGNAVLVRTPTNATVSLVSWPRNLKGYIWKAMAHVFGGTP